MDVSPGEIIHMDENGACKFPADKLEAVLNNLQALKIEEEARIGQLQKAKTVAEIVAIFGGHSYTSTDEVEGDWRRSIWCREESRRRGSGQRGRERRASGAAGRTPSQSSSSPADSPRENLGEVGV